MVQIERDLREDASFNVAKAQYCKFEENDPYLVGLRKSWDANIHTAFNELPSLEKVFEERE